MMAETKPGSKRINYDSISRYFKERDDSYLMIFFLNEELLLIRNTGKLDSDDAGSSVSGSLWRRIFIRSLFAYIEGTCFRLKQDVRLFKECSPQEDSIISEKSYVLDEKGSIKKRDLYLRPIENIRFAFRIYAGCFGPGFKLKTDGNGWNSYKNALKIRNRITHPKKIEDLKIPDEEWACIVNARTWFDGEYQRLLEFRKKAENKE
jgi:hypothetical protein